jgi:methionyl-tRNA formyltransferase
MQLARKMDAGPIYAQETVPLRGDETKQALADQLADLGKDMLLKHLPSILDGSAQLTQQDASNASYDQLITKADGKLDAMDWNQPVASLNRQVRAYAGWPRTRTSINDIDVIITSSHASQEIGTAGTLRLSSKELGIYGSDGLLIIDTLIPAGKREMSAQAFRAGYQLQ